MKRVIKVERSFGKIGRLFLTSFLLFSPSAFTAGISVDEGLTPPEDRVMVRSQLRYMQMGDDPGARERRMHALIQNNVVAYGVHSSLTVLVRQALQYRKMTSNQGSKIDTGLGDLATAGKLKLFRKNTRHYSYGLAGTVEFEYPTGSDVFSSNTFDIKPGLYQSFRRGPWASDLSLTYKWNGPFDEGRGGIDPGDEIHADGALAYQFVMGKNADFSVAPVVELSYHYRYPDYRGGDNVPNAGDYVVYVSPGIKITKSSLVLELLFQIPVWQDQKGNQLEREFNMISGVRVLF